MLFLEQEKEKFIAWCQDISMRELALYFISAFCLLFIVFIYYDALGITGLFQWYRFGRNMGECFLLIFFTELMTGKNLLHPFWRIGYIPFFSWILIFPYVLTHAVNGMKDPTFNHLSPYFLTAIGTLLLIFFVMNVICLVYVGRNLATLICLAIVSFFSFSAFIFLTHYEFMGLMMSPRETFFALYQPVRWFHRIVLPHVGLVNLLLMAAGVIAFELLYWKWIYESAYHLPARWQRKAKKSYSCIHRLLQFLVFFGCLWLLVRWLSECFPLHDYELAKQYKEYIDFIQNTRL